MYVFGCHCWRQMSIRFAGDTCWQSHSAGATGAGVLFTIVMAAGDRLLCRQVAAHPALMAAIAFSVPSFQRGKYFLLPGFPTLRVPSPLWCPPTVFPRWVGLLSLCYAHNRVLRKKKRRSLFDGLLGIGGRGGWQPWYVTWRFRFGRRGHIPQESLFIGVVMTSLESGWPVKLLAKHLERFVHRRTKNLLIDSEPL